MRDSVLETPRPPASVRSMRPLHVVLWACSITLLACATDSGPPHPAGRWLAAMVYDTAAHRFVLLTGSNALTTRFFDDSWSWDGEHWTLLSPSGLGQRDEALADYDPAANHIVVFGGRSPQLEAGMNVALFDTWEGNGSTWTKRASSGPGVRPGYGGGFDANRGRLVLFGGTTTGNGGVFQSTDTWEWNGQQWMVAATTGPPGSSLTGPPNVFPNGFYLAPSNAVYLAGRGKLVMLVGSGLSASSNSSEIWEWSGSAWSVVGTGPGGTMPMAVAAVGADELLIFDGGSGVTYLWNGTTTTQVATTGPGRRDYAAIASDAARHRVLLFGGQRGGATFADTWLWDGGAWALQP